MIDDDEGDDYDGDCDDDYDDDEEEKEKDVREGKSTPNRLDSNTFICNLYGSFGKNFFLWYIISQQFTF